VGWHLIPTPGAEVCHTQRITGICPEAVTYQKAKNMCKNAGTRLCTLKEARSIFGTIHNTLGSMPASQCGGTKAMWTSTQCELGLSEGSTRQSSRQARQGQGVGHMTASTRYNTTNPLDTWPFEQCVDVGDRDISSNSQTTSGSGTAGASSSPQPQAFVSCCADTESSQAPTCAIPQASVLPSQLKTFLNERKVNVQKWGQICGNFENEDRFVGDRFVGPFHDTFRPLEESASAVSHGGDSKLPVTKVISTSVLGCAAGLSSGLQYPALPATAVTSIEAFKRLVGDLCQTHTHCDLGTNIGGGRWMKREPETDKAAGGEGGDVVRRVVVDMPMINRKSK
jgi:hypothetical protein